MNDPAPIRIIASEKNRMEGEAVHKDAIWTPEHIDEVVTSKMAKTLEKAMV